MSADRFEVVEMSRSTYITWTFPNMKYVRKYLIHDRGARIVVKRYEVKDVYGIFWAHREYTNKPWNIRFLVRERLG